MRNTRTLEQLRDTILLAALPNIAFDGWSITALDSGAADAGMAKQDVLHAFPGGVADAIAHWSGWADRQAVAAMESADMAHMRTHQRIAMGVWARLQALGRWRDAARKATAWLAQPAHAPLASRLTYRTSDAIWRAAGDASTDFNFYTKRALLGGVVLSTTLYWLRDSSEGAQSTSAFLDRRIDDVLKVGGQIGKARAALERFDPVAMLRRFRPSN